MNQKDRKSFWDMLSNMRDASPKQIESLRITIKMPHTLCRFRSVSESTLTQLQENKLFFSTADRYDDPFDTYFYINYPKLQILLDQFNNMLNDPTSRDAFVTAVSAMGIPAKEILEASMASSALPNMEQLKERICQVRDTVQKNLYSICFCEDPLNETLWLKYGDNHRGFVLVYDFYDNATRLCGFEEKCKNCGIALNPPNIYPVYYSNKRYDATRYTVSLLLSNALNITQLPALQALYQVMQQSMMWEIERISLIKKYRYHYDGEWRMILPTPYSSRPSIKLKPKKIIIGLRTPEYKKLLIAAAAKVAGISQIYTTCINEKDRLALAPFITEKSP